MQGIYNYRCFQHNLIYLNLGSTTKKGNVANPGLAQAQDVPPPSFSVITGDFELKIRGTATGEAFLGWTPTKCSLNITNSPQPDLNVVLRNRSTSEGGQVVFRNIFSGAESDTLSLTVPGDGSEVSFYMGGKFGSPSFHNQDGAVSVHDAGNNNVLHQRTLMVRIRKDANVLTDAERDRFLTAFATLNSDVSAYQVFLDDHNAAAYSEIHRRPSFLPWHRAFVLDLERQLQNIDSSITIPYWRFELTAPNVFIPDFMGGTPDSAGRVTLSGTNPLGSWSIGGTSGIRRVPGFNTSTGAPSLLDESQTLALGTTFSSFDDMEGDPHDQAHISFTGPLDDPTTATQDPIFFMLHCNVDRLWAKWQLANDRFNMPSTNSYSADGDTRIGNNPGDTMWPWNGVSGAPRPPTAPGGRFPQLTFPSKPSERITLTETIDYIGRTEGNELHFDYDDVPYI